MDSASLPAAAADNGRLLVSMDEWVDTISSCLPCIDSPNRLPIFGLTKTSCNEGYASDGALEPRFDYVRDTNTSSTVTPDGFSIQHTVIDVPLANTETIADVHACLYCKLSPNIDSTSDLQQRWLDI